jgi:hypothetical protein
VVIIVKPHRTPSSFPVINPSFRGAPDIPQEAEGLPEDVRIFYDPTGKNGDEPLPEFLNRVASTRSEVNLPGLGPISGHEVIVAESTHALMDGAETLPVDLSEERRLRIRQATVRQAGRIALSVMDAADGLEKKRDAVVAMRSNIRIPTLPPRLVVAGKVLAAVAHQHVRRRSGRPYYAHPDEVASIFSVAWRKQYGMRSERMPQDLQGREGLLDTIRFLSYAHDAYEDTIDTTGGYLAKPVIVTPLVAEKILESQKVMDARSVARTLLFMARTKDVEGDRMSYRDYIASGAKRGGEYFLLTKAPDIRHNLTIEPDHIEPGDERSAKKLKKREQYSSAAVQVLRELDPYSTSWLGHSVFTVTRQEVAAETGQKYFFDLNVVAQDVHDRIAESSASDA